MLRCTICQLYYELYACKGFGTDSCVDFGTIYTRDYTVKIIYNKAVVFLNFVKISKLIFKEIVVIKRLL